MRTRAAFPGAGVGVEPGQKGMTLPCRDPTPDEVLTVVAQRPDTVVGIRIGHRHRLVRAGLRVGEALALQPKDVDLGIGSITVLHGKGDRRRTVGIDPGAAPHVERSIEVRRDQLAPPPLVPLFCSRKCRPMSRRSMVGEMLARSARAAGIDKRVHPHGFRHTMAYELLMEGVPIPVIQRQLGHASLQTTDTYLSHIAPKQVLEFMNARSWGGS